MPNLKLPDFPANELGLKRGTILKGIDSAVRQLGLKPGDRIPIGYDGHHVRCSGFTWSIDQLVYEIRDWRIWKIDGAVDLFDPARSLKFAQDIERLFLN